MARRVSAVSVQIEYMPDTNNRRVEAVGLMIEQQPDTNNRRVSAVGLMVEYEIVTGSASASASPSVSPSASPSVSPSLSPSSSESPSPSPSLSPSSSVSSSASPSPSIGPLLSGSVTWGHVTGVVEDNVETFANNWTGTGVISGSGDAETICLNEGEYMESNVVNTGTRTVELLQNNYAAGDTIILKFRHGNSEANCLTASWSVYTVPFDSLGYVQVRIEG